MLSILQIIGYVYLGIGVLFKLIDLVLMNLLEHNDIYNDNDYRYVMYNNSFGVSFLLIVAWPLIVCNNLLKQKH